MKSLMPNLQTLHAICDLGLAIAKRLVRDQTEISAISAVPLPHMLYKLVEKNKDVSSVVSILSICM